MGAIESHLPFKYEHPWWKISLDVLISDLPPYPCFSAPLALLTCIIKLKPHLLTQGVFREHIKGLFGSMRLLCFEKRVFNKCHTLAVFPNLVSYLLRQHFKASLCSKNSKNVLIIHCNFQLKINITSSKAQTTFTPSYKNHDYEADYRLTFFQCIFQCNAKCIFLQCYVMTSKHVYHSAWFLN